MIPGHTHRKRRKSNSGLRLIRKLRVARRQTILRRMLTGAFGDGDPADDFQRSPESMRRRSRSRSDGKELWTTLKEDDSNRLALSCNLLTVPSLASSSISDDDKSAGQSAVVDDDVSIGGDKINRSTATVAHGVISLMGRRREMEDAVTAVPSLVQTLGSALPYGFFAVYDGHGGFAVAEKCKERLHCLVAEEIGGGRAIDDVEVGARADWEGVMRMSFARMDREVCGEEGEASGDERREAEGKTTGSTAVVAVVGAEEIVVANCGDSRAVLCRGEVAMPLSRDHKPERPDERERVEAAGGSVVNWYGPRVLGVLATSRSIGDHCMRPYVISVPEVTVCPRTQLDEFLILASDGLWDVVSNDMACELVKKCVLYEQRGRRRRVSSEEDNCGEGYADHLATMLAEVAISRGSRDNISVIVVMLC